MTSAFRMLAALGGFLLLGLIVWAAGAADMGASFSAMMQDPWGVVALADLYLGFLILAAVIWIAEPNKALALAFILPLPVLGNVWAALWLALRLGRLAAKMRGTT